MNLGTALGRRTAINLLLAVAFSAGCVLPGSSPTQESLAFNVENNQLVLSTVRVGGVGGRFLVASAMPITVLDSRFVSHNGLDRMKPFDLTLAGTSTVRVAPNVIDLGGQIDGLIGADVLGPVLAIDFRREILGIRRRAGFDHRDLRSYRFHGRPSIPIRLDGRDLEALIDTTVPDTLIAPAELSVERRPGRGPATVQIGGVTFQSLDVSFAPVETVRIGNRLLSEFMVIIDYDHGRVSLWRYP